MLADVVKSGSSHAEILYEICLSEVTSHHLITPGFDIASSSISLQKQQQAFLLEKWSPIYSAAC